MSNTASQVKVSVVIPTYNRAPVIGRALDSVLSQSWRDLEVIVVDDGSNDETREFVAQRADSTDLPIRYVQQENAGECAARNTGIRASESRYVAFLDSDDVWESTRLDLQMDYLRSHPEIKLVCGIAQGLEGRERGVKLRGDHAGDLFSLLYGNCFVNTSTVLMARACFDDAGLFDESYEVAGDYDMWLRVAKRHPIAYLDRPLARCDRSETRLSSQKVKLRHNTIRSLEAHDDARAITRAHYRRRRSDLEIYLGRAHLREGEIEAARSAFARARALTPLRMRPLRYALRGRIAALFSPRDPRN